MFMFSTASQLSAQDKPIARRLAASSASSEFATTSPAVSNATEDSLGAGNMKAGEAGIPIFEDGFETGNTCAWSPGTCPTPSDLSGSWLGEFDFDGTPRWIALQLEQRGDGRLFGYILGGTGDRSILSGSYAPPQLDLHLEFESPAGVSQILLTGTVAHGLATLTASGDISTQLVELTKTGQELTERRWMVVDTIGENLRTVEIAAAFWPGGALAAGGWVGKDDCTYWGCDGGLTSFSESGATIQIGLETAGGCSDGSSLEMTFEPSVGIYQGTFVLHDCSSTRSGPLFSTPTTGTTSIHVAEILTALGTVADQLESNTAFSLPHDVIPAGYLSNGKDAATLIGELNAEQLAYDDRLVELRRVNLVYTIEDPKTFPGLVPGFGIHFEQIRSGVPVAAGSAQGLAARETYLDTSDDPFAATVLQDLRGFAEVSGSQQMMGDQQPMLDLPFDYSIGSEGLEVPTPQGTVLSRWDPTVPTSARSPATPRATAKQIFSVISPEGGTR